LAADLVKTAAEKEMAKLLLKSEGLGNQVIQLKLGLNRFGRTPGNDFQIDHATVSSRHCEIEVSDGELTVRDCDSTNGTFIDGERVVQATLKTGQTLRLGDVQLFVETTDVTIAIPKFDVARPAPPLVLTDGSLVCPRHPRELVTHQCTYCLEVLCDSCVHRLRRKGGKVLKLCPLCSHQVELIGGPKKKKKKSLFAFLQNTVKLPFMGKQDDSE
jgi:hypothetical protein